MSEQTHREGSIGSKFVEEFKAMAALAAYLYVCFGAIILFKSAVLREAGIHYEIWGLALVKALILAKFMLIGRMLHVGGAIPGQTPDLANPLSFTGVPHRAARPDHAGGANRRLHPRPGGRRLAQSCGRPDILRGPRGLSDHVPDPGALLCVHLSQRCSRRA